ncbi:hypothetical protein BD410DRAFT_840773 [Rickenella mellea]|uniref:Uncharacterized protein n=1 Tax=Rickenella mellea TaxID=50990 RepID=A0A4Y7Q151_9AGAM|nr:hypothetical protein BD410DRAFT_840773 [Rickenella mellea]
MESTRSPGGHRAWSISRLDNDKYTIRNIGTNHYAASPSFPKVEGNIITTQNLQQWDIRETGVKGKYVIYTTAADIDLFWGLANGQLETPISLREIPNTPSNQWELTKVDLWRVVGHLRGKLAEHTKLFDDYRKLQDEHRKLQDENLQLRRDMKLRDEERKPSDSVGLMDIKVALDAVQQERARHARAEAKLVTSHQMAFQQERERHTRVEGELITSQQIASQQERARHLQAEAELRTYYEKLLAEKVREAEKWRRARTVPLWFLVGSARPLLDDPFQWVTASAGGADSASASSAVESLLDASRDNYGFYSADFLSSLTFIFGNLRRLCSLYHRNVLFDFIILFNVKVNQNPDRLSSSQHLLHQDHHTSPTAISLSPPASPFSPHPKTIGKTEYKT